MSLLTPSDIQHSAATQIWGCYRLVSRAKVIENQQSCLLRHLRLPTLLFTPILSQAESVGEPMSRYLMEAFRLEDPQTPPVPQDEDEREPMFVQAHDPDYVPEPIYPEYIPLEDEHEFPTEEHPLPPIVSSTAEPPGYVTESDPEEDPEEYEDDETKDGQVDYPMDGGDDGDDDDGDSSRDDADDEDEDEEEEHPAPADSAVVIPTVKPDSPPEGTEPIMPPPSTDISTTEARITVRLQASKSLPLERLARCMAPPALSSPLLPSFGCPTQIQTLRIASTQALIDAVTAALPSPPLPPLPPYLYIPPPVDCRDDLPNSTARPTGGQGVDYGFVSTVDAEERQKGMHEVGYGVRDTWVDPTEAVPEVAPMTMGEVNTRVTKLAELHERDTQDLYALLEDAQDERVWRVEEEDYASREAWAHSIGLSQVHETRFQMQQAEIAVLRETDRRRQDQMAENLRVMRDMRIPDHQDASGDADSHI
ncbi:hypothetical protein Tco_0478444 [Tanacetum coccineum]